MALAGRGFDLKDKRVWVAGHNGMVGAALTRRLKREGCRMLTAGRDVMDLRNQDVVRDWMMAHRPQAVFLAAAKVGGILANDVYPADFLYDNLMIEANIIHAAHLADVEKLLFLGSSCIYPKFAPQPIPELAMLTGSLEPTNEWYAIAKIAGLKMCQAYRKQHGRDFISAMPTNLYGPGDNFDLNSSHVIPALMRKAHEAKLAGDLEMVIWGTGTPLREFLHVDDCADALVYLMMHYSGDGHINVGSGTDISIQDLARMVMAVVGYDGKLSNDTGKPDGTPRKVMDVSRLAALGWNARIALQDGLRDTYLWFKAAGHVRASDYAAADASRP